MRTPRPNTVVILFAHVIGPISFCSTLPAQEPAPTVSPSRPADLVKVGEEKLRIAKAVACRSIDGYERYTPLPGGSITAEEKLQIYYRVLRCKFAVKGDEYQVHLIQDGQIRRKGDKAALRSKKKILDYEAKTSNPPSWLFLRNSIPLKGLTPGDYEYDIILRDEYNPGPPVIQTVRFHIVAPVPVKASQGGKAS